MAEKKMAAKFPGTCNVCSKGIRKHEIMWWARETGCRHLDCEATSARACNCNCDGWCEDCSSLNCFATDHGRRQLAAAS